MSAASSSAAPPIARFVLRILVILNWLTAAAILALLTFLLAFVFAEGTRMREELEGTV